MSCSRFRECWHAGADEAHADACPACAAWLAGQRVASSALSRLAAALAEDGGRDRELELRAAFRRREAHGAPWPWALAAAAVVALVAVTLGLLAPEPKAGRVADQGMAAAAAAVPQLAAPIAVPAANASSAGHARGPAAEAARGGRADRERARQAVARRMASPAPRVRSETPAASEPRETEAAQVAVPVPPAAAAEIAAAALAAAHAVLEVQSTVDDAARGSAPPARPSASGAAEGRPATETPARRAAADDREFYPLGADNPAVRAADDRIVRVQLRVDVLDAAGVKREGTASGPVEAEVLVGRDGVARGVRLARPRP